MNPILCVPRGDEPALAAFVHRANRRPDGRARCLHADQGEDVATLLAELRALADDERCLLAARDGERWLGMVGAEHDSQIGRAWVRGPLTDPPDPALAARLLQRLLQTLPVARLDAFVQADEAAALQTLGDAGFRRRALFSVMRCDGPPPPAPDGVHDADAAEAAQAARLHEAAFPATYMTPQTLQAQRDDDHRLLVATEGGEVVAYLYGQVRPLEAEGYVDFLAVAEPARGRGHGRRLLAAALHWALAERGMSSVALTVQQDRAPALGLYRQAGFREVAAGVQMVFERQPAAQAG